MECIGTLLGSSSVAFATNVLDADLKSSTVGIAPGLKNLLILLVPVEHP